MSPFSQFLKALRVKRRLRQHELARVLGYEQSYVSALERSDKGPPRREFIERLTTGLALDDEEKAGLTRSIEGSRRQLVLPVKASDQEYALMRLLEPQLGRLSPLQIQLIEAALCIPETASDLNKTSLRAIATGKSHCREEGRIM
jgi:transcriptional regulator with XRE-family HTH domain